MHPLLSKTIDETKYERSDGFVLVPEKDFGLIKAVLAAQAEVEEYYKSAGCKKMGKEISLPEELCERFLYGGENPIKVIRKYRGFSQQVLAERAGVSKTMISHIENGRKHPSARTLQKLSWALYVDMEYLI